MRKMGHKVVIGVFFILAVTTICSSFASDFPERAIEMVIPYAPGGSPDIANRPWKEKISKVLGQPLVVLFKPGAGGAAGTTFVARAKPDGYTLLAGSSTPLVLVPLTTKGIAYTQDDFIPICNFAVTVLVWVVKEDSPYKTMQDFIQAARTKKMKYATYGTHGLSHICMEMLGKVAGFQSILIPYAGGNPALAAVLGGHADIGVTPGSLGMAGPGKLRIIAVGWEKRLELYPDVPTLAELGYPIDGSTYFGVFAPKGTSNNIINKIYGAYKKVLEENRKEFEEYYKSFENALFFLGPEDTGKLYKKEYNLRKKMIEESGILIK